jgi:hypothetical protein
MSTVSYTPSFVLNVDVNKIYNDYATGRFSCAPPILPKLNLYDLRLSVSKILSNDRSNGRFSMYGDEKAVLVTSNHVDFTYLLTSKNEDSTVYRCLNCTRDIKGKAVGIPKAREMYTQKQKNIIRTYYIYHTKGKFCHYDCAWSYLVRSSTCGQEDFTAISHLRCLVRFLDPQHKLRLLPEADKLVVNGGTVSDKEFDDKTLFHRDNPLIITIPMKTVGQLIKR